MKQTRLAAAVFREVEKEGITISDLCKRVGRTHGAMSQLFGHGMRASAETMAALSRRWALPGAGARVMIAHLQDELARAQWPIHEYQIEHHDATGSTTTSQLEADLADIRAAAEYVPALGCLIADVLAVARAELPASLFERAPTRAAADGKTAYRINEKLKNVDGHKK